MTCQHVEKIRSSQDFTLTNSCCELKFSLRASFNWILIFYLITNLLHIFYWMHGLVELYGAVYFAVFIMLENRFWKIGQKTCDHSELYSKNSVRACVFRSIFWSIFQNQSNFQDFGICKINCSNQLRCIFFKMLKSSQMLVRINKGKTFRFACYSCNCFSRYSIRITA